MANAPSPSNRLAGAASPYLRRQASQPVAWQRWDDEPFGEAAGSDRPILVSVGYASSWQCAAADAFFEDLALAALINDEFVAVKVDREERPDVEVFLTESIGSRHSDAEYPLTVVMTPEGHPFDSRPAVVGDSPDALRSWLGTAGKRWREDPDEVRRRAGEALEQLRRSAAEPARGEAIGPALLQQAVMGIQAAFDDVNGGFGEAPRPAHTPAIEFMLRAGGRGIARATTVAESTLRKMLQGGIYDQVGGGFHHLSLDRTWQVPRFEKLLVDNALLARAYTHGWQLVGDGSFSRVALEILEYLLRDLSDPAGAFFAGEYAGGGREGDYYTWTYEEFTEVAPDAAAAFGVTAKGNFRGRNVLRLAGDERPPAARAALLKRRAERSRPERDEMILTSWNGIAVAALAEAGAALDRPDLLEAARRTASTILLRNRHRSTGRLWHAHPDREDAVPGMLEDYAYLAEGLYTLWETTFEPEWITTCEELVRTMLDDFWDPAGGLYTTAGGADAHLPRRKDPRDRSGPSAAAVASVLLGRLGVLTGNREYGRKAAEILGEAVGSLQDRHLEVAGMLGAVDALLAEPVEIVVLGSTTDRRTRELRKQIWLRYLPNKVAAGAPPLIPFPIMEGKEAVGGAPTAHVSRGSARKPPVLEPEEFEAALKFWTSPSDKQVGRLTTLIGNALQRRHFFDNLQNPAWVEPLRDAGLFEGPPAPIYDFAEGTVGSPPWPESRYLARMAPFRPEAVLQVAIEVPDAENVQVAEDLADVALALPVEMAVKFVPKAREWLKSPYLLHLPEKLGNLVVRLAQGGQTQAAIELAEALFELLPGDPSLAKQPVWLAPEPRGRYGRFTYETILQEQMPVLARKAPLPTLELLADLLSTAIALSHRPEDQDPPHDFSHLWRPAIHEHEQNVDKTLREPLATALADVAEEIAREQPSMVPELVRRLERRQWHIFRRIALHLLRVWPEVSPEMLARRLTDRHIFADPHFHHEYLLLARDHFEDLSPEDQAVILGWIDEGPDIALWRSDPRTLSIDDSGSAGADAYRDRWRLDRLAMLHESLPPSHLNRYQQLVDRYGLPEHPDFVVYLPPARTDPTTPKQADELHETDADALVDFLSSWRPAPGLGNPSAEGLARKLAAVVATEPARFAEAAASFRELDPVYVWAILQGLREASEGFEFEWKPVLELATWVAGVKPGPGEDARWRPARLEVARLLARGFGRGPAQLPFRFRKQAWAAVSPLTDAPDEPVGPGIGGDESPAAQSAGMVRGEALNAVMGYALWVRREIESSPNVRERLMRGFDEMPEVREVLEAHLDPKADPSPAIRSVYGRWFSFLLMLDNHWATAQVSRIFPDDPSLEHLRQAAWEAHVSFSSPYDHLLNVIEGEYRRGVELVDRFNQRPPNVATPENRLAEHLMVFYLRGRIALDKAGLLGRFFAKAPEKLRHHALAFIGRSLKNQEGRVPNDFSMRIQALWERRMQAVEQAGDVAGFAGELSAFGWWFASGKLETSWSVRQLLKVLELGVQVEPANLVIARLKELDASLSGPKVEALARILAQEQDSVNLVAWTEDARTILNEAIASGDDAARGTALNLLTFFDVQELEELVRWDQ